MMREEIQKPENKTGIGKKVLVTFGIIFVALGVFLGSFACSFQVMIESAKASNADENTLESENAKLKETVQMLEEQVEILEAELEQAEDKTEVVTWAQTPRATSSNAATSKPKATTTATSKPTATAKPTATPKPTATAAVDIEP